MGVVQDKKETRPTVWYLFNRRFMCRVPPLALRSIEDIKLFGTPTTGNPLLDKEMEQEWALRMLNIAEMEDCFHRGYNVRLTKYSDSKVIYDLITDHLIAWRTFFETIENNRVPDETIDELVRLDKFATVVYIPARHLFTEETAQTVFGRYRQARRAASLLSRNMFTKQDAKNQEQEVDENGKKKGKPERISMASSFNRQRTSALGSAWRQTDIGGKEWK